MDSTLSFVAALAGLGLLDALNPFSIAAAAYLIGTPRPVPRTIAFILGTFVTYLIGGIGLTRGLVEVIELLLPRLPLWSLPAGELLLGAICVIGAVYLWVRAARGTALTPPKNLGIAATLAFAIATTVSDMPTALPYFAAVAHIAARGEGWASEVGWLTLYNLLYVSPMLLLLKLHLTLGQRAARLFGRVQAAIDWTFAKLMPPLTLAFGAWLVWDGGSRLASA